MFDLTLCLCVFAAVWSWTSSSRRTSCSRWWWGFALRRTATSPLCLTPRRPSPPPRNASPKLTPRSTLAGNFGSCKNTGPSPPPLLMHRIYASVYSSIFVWFSHRLQFCYQISFGTPGVNGELHHWILSPFSQEDRMCTGTHVRIPWKIQKRHACQKLMQSYFELISSNRVWNYTKGMFSQISKVRRQIWLPSVYLHIFF